MSDDDDNVVDFPIRRPVDPPGPQIGDVVAGGRYTLLECKGEGGLGRVFLAVDASGFRHVAIKTIVPRYSRHPLRQLRLFNEFHYLEQITDRSHVVAPIECGRLPEFDDWPYLVLEHITGISLFQRMLQAKRITPSEIIDIGIQTARGIQAIHRARVVHRDITPQNLLLVENGERWHVKIIDFSHGADADAPRLLAGDEGRLTGMHEVPGTSQYMPPEQANAQAADPSMDVYSFGIVLYEMITGRNPFAGMPRRVYIRLARSEGLPVDPLDPRVHPDLPESLLRLTGRCLRQSPAGRPSIDQVVRRLEAIRGEDEFPEGGRVQPLPARPVPVVGEVAGRDEPDAFEVVPTTPMPAARAARVEVAPVANAAPVADVAPAEPSPAVTTVPDAMDGPSPVEEGTGPGGHPSWVAIVVPATIVMLLTLAVAAWLWKPGATTEPDPAPAQPLAGVEPRIELRDDMDPEPIPAVPHAPQPIEQPRASHSPREQVSASPAAGHISSEPPVPPTPARLPSSEPRPLRRRPAAAADVASAKAQCVGVVEAARAARAAHDWHTVVEHTRDRGCWMAARAERLAWRVEALSELRRWKECAQLGDQAEDSRIRFLADACRARLTREETP
jgi:tRNA A-37 threonylcarbamoyl transferase component Bud32